MCAYVTRFLNYSSYRFVDLNLVLLHCLFTHKLHSCRSYFPVCKRVLGDVLSFRKGSLRMRKTNRFVLIPDFTVSKATIVLVDFTY